MVRATSVGLFVALLFSTATATSSTSSQPSTLATSPSTTRGPSSTITSSSSSSSSYPDVPLSLLSVAESLLSKYYPSTTLTGVASLSWPGTVVIGTKTYHVTHPGSTKATTKTSERTSIHTADPTAVGAETDKVPHDQKGDKRLAIILGVVIGVVAFTVMGVIFCCLWRRRRQTGTFFMRRRTPSVVSNDSWRPGQSGPQNYRNFGTTSYVSGPLDPGHSKQPNAFVTPRGNTPQMAMHPAVLHAQSSRSTSDDNPFYTPEERSLRSTTHLNPHELDGQPVRHAELDHDEPFNRRSSSSIRNSRPPTPFSPMMMMPMPDPSSRPALHVNPFSSAEDAEADDVVSPILPGRSPERRHSPMVHYPSWDEVSEFNFSGNGRDRRAEDGGDGFQSSRQRVDGRHEMA